MPPILAELNHRLHDTLPRCPAFDSDRTLRAVFTDTRLYVWRNRVPETAPDREGRVALLIDALCDQAGASGENALLLFLQVLAEHTPPADALHKELVELAQALADAESGTTASASRSPAFAGRLPPLPALIVGREQALHDLKTRLGILPGAKASPAFQVLTAVRGWPGVGKTTLAAAIAHDPDLRRAFPDGVLWTSLGPEPNLFGELAAWGRTLDSSEIQRAQTVEAASAQLAALLRDRRMLLIVDDVWAPEHAVPFNVGGRRCALLITTRVNSVAQDLAPTPGDVYRLPVLTDDKALELLAILAPQVVERHPEAALDLVHELEGLPLALQVAGHLLNVEASYGFDVTVLLADLREGAKLLAARAPADRTDLENETTPTVAALLQTSTDCLDEATRECFAFLGAFAPKPATFDLDAMQAVWLVDDPKPIARTLVDRGLLEPLGPSAPGRFQMHALLVMHARSLCTDG